ncbi:hypothetical protein BC835DRAFT_1373087 [Cytidiella melzeri]|nr:hypothetical protein BC835DRAFT_1373087 [Cytidiella melzeri]
MDNSDVPPAISLMFAKNLRVAGEVLEGEVHLNFPVLTKSKVEEVHIKLRGSVYTKLPRRQGETEYHRTQRFGLIHDTISLWQQSSSVYPPPDSHVLRLPFHFILPHNLPPSCEFTGFAEQGIVAYFIEVVGRRGALHLDKRILCPISVMQSSSPGALLRASIRAGWQGPWKVREDQKEIRRGIWGDYAHVKMTLVMPDIPILPVLTNIPFTLNIVTLSKPDHKDDSPSDKPIFPAPPLTPDALEFCLEQRVYICANGHESTSSDHLVCYVGGMGPSLPATVYKAVEVEVMDKEWLPSVSDQKKTHCKGQWKQEVIFKSSMQYTCPPTFTFQTMAVTVCLTEWHPSHNESAWLTINCHSTCCVSR